MDIGKLLRQKIDLKTKPKGSLGLLEQIAFKIGKIQDTLTPNLSKPHILIFAADHGIAQEGVSAYPPEVTYQMVQNFLNGGAAINVFCKQHNIELKIIDAGVNFDFGEIPTLITAKTGKGTANFLYQDAMTAEQFKRNLEYGKNITQQVLQTGCNIIGFGEMGIANTSAATLIIATLLDLPVADCVGRGTGLTAQQVIHKQDVLRQAYTFHQLDKADVLAVLQKVGGFEIVQICAGMLAAYRQGATILIDGFIASAALVAAQNIEKDILNNCIFCHLSDEYAHQFVLEKLGVDAILKMNMRLGEGTGCALAYPVIASAVAFLNEMSSFEEANVRQQ
jgi:nicotinate-nucleotide--dimethylbenzimidazole phosphoribosyltransferase